MSFNANVGKKKRTVFVDRRALRADRAAITSHEAASLIYRACRFDDSSRFSGDYLSVFWPRLALKGLFKFKMCSAARSVRDVYATLSSCFNVNAKQLISLVVFKHSTRSNVQKSPKSPYSWADNYVNYVHQNVLNDLKLWIFDRILSINAFSHIPRSFMTHVIRQKFSLLPVNSVRIF